MVGAPVGPDQIHAHGLLCDCDCFVDTGSEDGSVQISMTAEATVAALKGGFTSLFNTIVTQAQTAGAVLEVQLHQATDFVEVSIFSYYYYFQYIICVLMNEWLGVVKH